MVFSPIFHYSELHLGLEGTLYILAGLMATGVVFGWLFFPLEDEDENGNKKVPEQKEADDDTLEDAFSCLKSHMAIFRSLPMVLVLLSHLLMHLGQLVKLAL